MSSIEGSWFSKYEYGQGPDNEPHISEHHIQFTQSDEGWIGQSMPSTDGSEVTLLATTRVASLADCLCSFFKTMALN